MRFLPLIIVAVAAAVTLGAITRSNDGIAPRPRAAIATAASGLAAGDYHGCALTDGGGVKCWGWNPYGELGDGRACGFSCPFVVSTSGLESGVESIAAGGYHTCAVMTDGSATCWGANASGQLGIGNLVQHETPVDVAGLSNVAKLAAGYNHTCALTDDGGVLCWGDNDFGQLGDGSTVSHAQPEPVSGLSSGVADIAAGGFSSCAVLDSGSVRCWGYNSLGQLGDGTAQDRTTPTTVMSVTTATQVSAGVSHACALTSSGGVKCWGSNAEGQLGDGTTVDHPTAIDGGGLTSGISQISAGGYHTCVLTTGGAVRCWGDNSWSQLGGALGCGEICLSPVNVPGLATGVIDIAGGLRHSCAIAAGGAVTCWGANDAGQLATGARDANANPPFHPPVTLDIKALVTVTPPQFPTFTPTPTLRPGETPVPTPTPLGFCGTGANIVTNGPRIGMTTDRSASIWVRTCQPASISVQHKVTGTDWSSAQVAGPVSTDSGADNTALVPIDNLQTDTAYEYRVLVNGALPAQPLEGGFRTMPAEGEEASFSFFIGTDMHLSDFPMATILDSVAQHDPLFGVLGGDSVLVETFQVPPVSQRAYDASYRVRLANDAFQEFQADVPLAFLWSDHEIYNDWDHRTSAPYPYARRTFDAYMGAGNPTPRDPAGTQYTFKAADIEFYVIDDRTFRSPGERPDGPNKTMLGAQQKQDLKNWLMTSDARFKFIVSDVWWNDFSGHTAYGESWPAYRTERNEIFDFIRDNDIPGVVLISGDEHQDGVFRLEPWGLYEIAPGPMSWTPSLPLPPDPEILFRGQYRVFGIFTVDTTACPATLDVRLYGETNNLLFSLPLTERDLGADTDGNGLVPCEEGTPGPTPTRTPTPTGARGDANCDGRIDSIDAALILQRTAGLLSNLPCAQNADVNRDGRTDSIDASLVLQYAAGLLHAFP